MIPLVLGLVVIIVAIVAYWLWSRHYEWTDDAFIDGHIVQISPKVSGYVTRLLITDNELVEPGQLLLEIDPADYLTALKGAKAAQNAATAQLSEAEAQLSAAEAEAKASAADVVGAKAKAQNATRDLARYRELAPQGAASQQSLDRAVSDAASRTADEAAAQARLASANAQVGLARARRQTAEAQGEEARARVAQAELNLSYTKLSAPIRGRVTRRTVELGNYLTPSQPLFALVDPDVWVTANYKETQLELMRAGQPVQVKVDAFPGHVLHGHIDSFQRGSGARFSVLPAENATGNYVKIVQRVPVKIVFDQPVPGDVILGPGMSVVPRVTVRQ